jgi:hypothetical protein
MRTLVRAQILLPIMYRLPDIEVPPDRAIEILLNSSGIHPAQWFARDAGGFECEAADQ